MVSHWHVHLCPAAASPQDEDFDVLLDALLRCESRLGPLPPGHPLSAYFIITGRPASQLACEGV